MRRSRVELIMFLADMFVILLALYVSYLIRINLPFGISGTDESFQIPPVLYFIVLIIWTLVFYQNSVYINEFGSKFRYRILNVLKSHIIACFIYFGVLYLTYRQVSRIQSLYFLILLVSGTILCRVVIRVIQYKFFETEARKLRVLVLGVGQTATQFKEKIQLNPRNNLRFIGFIPLPSDEITAELRPLIVGDLENLTDVIERYAVDEVVITPHWYSEEVSRLVSGILYQLQKFPVNVRLAPDYSEISFFQVVTEVFEGLPLLGLRVPVFTPTQRFLKRSLDLCIAIPLIIVGLPVFALIALLIRFDSLGPVILHQERVGIRGNIFTMYKFRSMYDTHNQAQFDETKLDVIKAPNDPRITPIGKILRRTSLDELPQLINVVKGEMSLVGPRPELPVRVKSYEWWQYKRFEVPQGMTGWWQINGRANRPMHLHTQDDLHYIEHYSIWTDLKILALTARIIFTGEGAF